MTDSKKAPTGTEAKKTNSRLPKSTADSGQNQAIINQFRDAALKYEVLVPENPKLGMIDRCGTVDKKRNSDGAYCLYIEGALVFGGFQNWTTGEGWQNWTYDIGRVLTPEEQATLNARFEAGRKEREAADVKRYALAAEIAREWWRESNFAPEDHAYLTLKCVKVYNLAISSRKNYNGWLMVPVCQFDKETDIFTMTCGMLSSLQFIPPAGKKRFLSGGKQKGGYFPIGDALPINGVICIGEGYATMATVHEQTGYPVNTDLVCTR